MVVCLLYDVVDEYDDEIYYGYLLYLNEGVLNSSVALHVASWRSLQWATVIILLFLFYCYIYAESLLHRVVVVVVFGTKRDVVVLHPMINLMRRRSSHRKNDESKKGKGEIGRSRRKIDGRQH
jgi:hypothetical protein